MLFGQTTEEEEKHNLHFSNKFCTWLKCLGKYMFVGVTEYDSYKMFWAQGFSSSCNPETDPLADTASYFFDAKQHLIYCFFILQSRGTALLCTKLQYTVLDCMALYCTTLHSSAIHFTVLHYTALYCMVISSHTGKGRAGPFHVLYTVIQLKTVCSVLYTQYYTVYSSVKLTVYSIQSKRIMPCTVYTGSYNVQQCTAVCSASVPSFTLI